MTRTRCRLGAMLPALALVLALAGVRGAPDAAGEQGRETSLGPVDGTGLPPTDLDRVAVGAPAPDFTLESSDGVRVRLSSFRGRKDVVLVFYRGHW